MKDEDQTGPTTTRDATSPTTLSRRDLLKLWATATAGLYVATRPGWRPSPANAVPAVAGLSDPARQPLFAELVASQPEMLD